MYWWLRAHDFIFISFTSNVSHKDRDWPLIIYLYIRCFYVCILKSRKSLTELYRNISSDRWESNRNLYLGSRVSCWMVMSVPTYVKISSSGRTKVGLFIFLYLLVLEMKLESFQILVYFQLPFFNTNFPLKNVLN